MTTPAKLCVWCPMHFYPEQADRPADDERGGTFTGWMLPEGQKVAGPHEHEIARCAFVGCLNDANTDEEPYCSSACRNRDIRERGE